MLVGDNVSRENIIMSTISAMFNRSTNKYADKRSQWYQPNPQNPTELASFTYAQVRRKVQALSGGLKTLGLNPQDRVAIMSFNCPQWIWADFSILCSGAITVTIYPSFSVHEITYIVNDSGSKYMYVRDSADVRKVFGSLESMPTLEKIIVFDDNAQLPNDMFIHLSTLEDMGNRYDLKHREAYMQSSESVKLWDIATIVYTSGTTGNPKGVVHTHFTLMSSVVADMTGSVRDGHLCDEDDILFCFLPLSHTYERQRGTMVAFATGGTIAYAESPSSIMRDIQIFNPHWFCGVPRIFERIYVAFRDVLSNTPEAKAEFEKAMEIGEKVMAYHTDAEGFMDLSLGKDFTAGLPEDLKKDYEWAEAKVFTRVRNMLGKNYVYAYSASASLPVRLFKAFSAMGIRVKEGYGLTESMNAVCSNSMKAVLAGAVGRVKVCCEAKVAEDGELLIKGDNVFVGYWNNPAADAEVFDDDGFFHTGDIAVPVYNSTTNEYWYKIVDRKKSIMVLDTGKNVARARVETLFSISHYVDQICAVADDRKFVSALIVPKYDAVMKELASKGISFDQSQMEKLEGVTIKVGDDFVQHPEVRALIDADVIPANQSLEGYEQIKKYYISNRTFRLDLEEVTPSLKIKYRVVIKNFADAIEQLYQ